MKRLQEQEEQERMDRLESERLKRIEEERKAAERILQMKMEEKARERQALEEAEARKLRDQEETKRLMLENMQRKMKADEEQKQRELEAERVRPKRLEVSDNPFLQRLEQMNKQKEIKEKAEQEVKQKKKKIWKKKSKEVLRMSRLMLAQALSKEKLATPEGKKLIKAVSKEILKVMSRENLKKSNCSLKRSRDNLRGSRDLLRTRSKGKLSKEALLSPGNQCTSLTDQPTKKDMQNYLISHVLFDGSEDVQSEQNKRMSKQQLSRVEENEKAEEEDREEKMFELYKQEMERYLDFIGQDAKDYKKKKTKKKVNKNVSEDEAAAAAAEKKLLINVGSIKNQFETLASPEVQEVEPPKPVKKKVGKINTKDLFAEQEKEREEELKAMKKKKKEYIPVIIDRDAFERTVGRFAAPTEPEIKVEPLKREKKVWQPPGIKVQEPEPEPEPEEEAEEEIEEQVLEEEPEPEPEPEPELTEEQRVAKMNIFERIQYELDKVKVKEAEQKKHIERENKKREIARQIQEQIEAIKALDKEKKNQEEEEIPTWVKLVQDPEARRKYKQQGSLEDPKPAGESEEKTEEKPEVDDTPQWIKIIKERQAQLRKFEIEYKARKEENDEKIKELSEKKKEIEEERPSFMAKKPDDLVIKTFSSVKDQFENQSGDDTTSPTSPKVISPYEINPERVRMIKEQLLKSREEKEKKVEKKDEGFLARKCSAIKNKLEQAFSAPNGVERKLSVKKPKKIINVAENPTIEQLLTEKKRQNAEKNWSYKQKDIKDLYQLLEVNQNVSTKFKDKVKEVEEHSSQVANKKKELLNLQEKIEVKEVEEYTDLMDRVHSYLSANEALSPEEQAFRNTIEGYLNLIQDDSKVVKKKKAKTKDAKDTLTTKSIQTRKLEMEQSKANGVDVRKSHTINKLDLSQYEQHDEEKLMERNSTEVGQGWTSSIRDQLIKSTQPQANGDAKITRKMKLIQVDHPKSVEESLKELKEQRQYEWQWKQKKISDLQTFIKKNEEKLRIEIPEPIKIQADEVKENIHYDVQLEDYMKLMDGIRNYLEKDDDKSKDTAIIKESLCDYLDLIEVDDDSPQEHSQFEWRSLGKVKDMKDGLENINDNDAKSDLKAVGKLNTKLFEKVETNDKPKSVVRTSNFYCNLIKNHLERPQEASGSSDGHIARKMKIVQVHEPESYEELLNQLKSRRQDEWKWKQKTIDELNNFLRTNEHGSKITANLDTNTKRFQTDTDLMNLRAKSEALAKSIQERDKTMKAFMNDLHEFSDKPSENTDEVVFKEGIKAFIDLIDEKNHEDHHNGVLPDIMNPITLDSKKEKYLGELNKQSVKVNSNKKVGKVDTKTLLTKKPQDEKKKEAVIGANKASLIKKMFESTKNGSMSRTMSELNLKPNKRPKVLIDTMKNETTKMPEMPMLQRRSSVKRQVSIPSYFSSDLKPSSSKTNQLPKEKPKGEWDHIDDPEEKKKAILAKYGFKEHLVKDYDDDPLEGVETIPNHILADEILYKKYMKENLDLDSSNESIPEQKKDPKQGSFSSLMNILSAVKKATMQKNAMDSRQRLDNISQQANETRLSASAQDLSQIPGSCINLRQHFEQREDEEHPYQLQSKKAVLKSPSCSNLGTLWSNHVNTHSSSTEHLDKSFIKAGLVTNLKDHLISNGEQHQQKSYALNDPVKRQSLSHLDLDENDEKFRQSDVKLELEALRSSNQNKGIFRLEKGRSNYDGLRRAQSHIEVVSESTEKLNLDDKELAELRASNQRVKAMFEANAPRYKYGGSGDLLNEEPKRGELISFNFKIIFL